MTSNAIQDAIDAAGDVYKLAAELGVSRQFLLKCRDRGWMPVRRAQEVEDKYGVPRETLIKPELRQFILGEG